MIWPFPINGKWRQRLSRAAKLSYLPRFDGILTVCLPLLILIAGFVFSYRSAASRHESEIRRLRNDIHAAVEPFCSELSRNIIAALHHAEGLVTLIALEGEPSPDRFRAFCEQLLRNGGVIRNIAIAPDNVVSQVYPLEGNEAVIGLRYRDNLEQWPSIQRMMDLKRIVVAGPVRLVQGGIGIIGRRPVYVQDAMEPEKERYWGLVSTVIDFPRLMSLCAKGRLPDNLEIALRGVDGLGASGAPFYGNEDLFNQEPVLREIPLCTGSWQLAALPSNGWPAFRPLNSTLFRHGMAVSFVLSVLIFALLSVNKARFREIMRRSATEATLRESQDRLMKAQQVARLGFLDWNIISGKIYASNQFLDLAGISKEHLPLTPEVLLNAVHPEDRSSLKEHLDQCLRHGSSYQFDHRFLHPDGRIVWVHTQGETTLNRDGIPIRLMGTVLDITLRVEAEEQLRRLNMELEDRVAKRTAELQAAMIKAREADRLKSIFLAVMSHELRTPLNSIIGFTSVLLKGLAGPLNDEQRKQLTITRESAVHLLALINDVLDISKIEAGQVEISHQPFDVRETLERAVRSVTQQTQAKGLDLSLKLELEIGPAIGDRRRVEQVLLNLLSNAVKFTEKGSVSVECRRIGRWIEVVVKDTGIGIRAEDMDKLFKPFQQIDYGTNRRPEGTGLGLAISKSLAKMMGGDLTCRSEWGKGSEFTFRFLAELEEQNGANASDRGQRE